MKRVILAVLISFSTVFVLFSTSVSAVGTTLSAQTYEIYRNDYNGGDFYWTTNIQYTSNITGLYGISRITVKNNSVSVGSNNYFSATMVYTIGGPTLFMSNNTSEYYADACRVGNTYASALNTTNTYVTRTTSTGPILYTFTTNVTGEIPSNSSGEFVCSFRYRNNGLLFYNSNNFNGVKFYPDYQGGTGLVDFTTDRSATIVAQNQQLIQLQQQNLNNQSTMISQNQQIINNQGELNQTIKDVNSTLTDSTVSGDFSVSAIPAFGPIAGILNNLLELPRILLAVPACTPIRPTLPFVQQAIEIPCMSTVYSQAYPAFITFLDAIASAYIWFRVARYIVRQVQHLRDPEQEDEEYLDI